MLLTEVPIISIAMQAEEKHGEDTHMVIEAVAKNPDSNLDIDPSGVDVSDVVWWVEFEDQVKTFDTFDEVERFLLVEAVASKPEPVV